MVSRQPPKRPWIYNPINPGPSRPFPGAISMFKPVDYSPATLEEFYKVNAGLPCPDARQHVDKYFAIQQAKNEAIDAQNAQYQLDAEKHLLDTYGVDINQEWETIPDDVLQKILRDPKYYYYIDGPNEGQYVG